MEYQEADNDQTKKTIEHGTQDQVGKWGEKMKPVTDRTEEGNGNAVKYKPLSVLVNKKTRGIHQRTTQP